MKVNTMDDTLPKLIVCSAREAFKYVIGHFSDPATGSPPRTWEQYAAISVQDLGNRNYGFTLTKNRFCRDVLTLSFDDIEEPDEGLCAFTPKQAAQIIAFLNKNRFSPAILIHCFAGMSRSAAIGTFAAEFFGLPDPGYPYCNSLVLDTLRTVRKSLNRNERNLSG